MQDNGLNGCFHSVTYGDMAYPVCGGKDYAKGSSSLSSKKDESDDRLVLRPIPEGESGVGWSRGIVLLRH